MIKVYQLLVLRVGVYGEKVIIIIITGKNNKYMYYYGKRIHKVR